ncbi:Csu type fimbrial protein [Sphingobium naphthae]|uniref:Spore coat protein U domain-containing protein n=1 Tax=Sphingobium naphthae TaxID=1886786 RepID=A0ABU3ZX58_9SPHN|nr:spore coat protein U domain-containing protein [Sphingobium naphthae]MDV5824107.1 spore coat protein U domain-containing protein [Sphingobium naphthae]
MPIAMVTRRMDQGQPATWVKSLLLLGALLFALLAFYPQQARANLDCSVANVNMDFGTAETGTDVVSWTCTIYSDNPANTTLCLSPGDPYPGTPDAPAMQNSTGTLLYYHLFRDPGLTQPLTPAEPATVPVSMPAGIGVTTGGTITIYGRIDPGQTVASGDYVGDFFNSVLGFIAEGSSECQSSIQVGDEIYTGRAGTFEATANREASCTISALGDADFGNVLQTDTNLSTSTQISVNCPVGTAYFIGLEPSNGNDDGAGVMAGSAGNSDTPGYQLRSASATGPIWGNSATETSVGNGVAGTGTGAADAISVFVTLPSTAFRPDSYSDVVTVNLNF